MKITSLAFAVLWFGTVFSQSNSVSETQNSIVEYDTIHFTGKFNGKNIFVRNPFGKISQGFTSKVVLLNDSVISAETNQSAYAIELISKDLEIGEKIKISIVYSEGIKPELLNSESLN